MARKKTPPEYGLSPCFVALLAVHHMIEKTRSKENIESVELRVENGNDGYQTYWSHYCCLPVKLCFPSAPTS